MTLHRFDVKMIKTTQNYLIDQITMNCMDLTSNWKKCRVLSQNIQNNAKLQKWSKYNDFASIWCQNDQNNAKVPKRSNYDELHAFDVELAKNVEFCYKTFKTTQNSKSDQNTMTWIDLMSNWHKCRVLSQNIQNNAKLQKWSKYNDLNRFDVELAKMSSFVTKHSKQRINQKWSKHNDFASIWCQNDQNNAKLPNRSNYDELHGFDVELEKMSSFVTKHSKQRKTPKVIKVQWLCIDLMSKWSKQRKSTKAIKYDELHAFDVELAKMSSFVTKHSKQRKTPKVIKIQWLESIWCRIGKNVEFCHKTFKTTQNSKSDQNTMTWIDLMSNWQKCRVLSQNIQNNAKTKSDQNTMTLHRFDVKMIKTTQKYQSDQITMNCMHLTSNWQKMSSFVTNHSKQRKTPKVIKIQWLE